MRRAAPTRLLAACVLLGACEYSLDVGPEWQIDHPRVIGLRMVVVEPAPIWPERVGFVFDDGAMAEALPGDRVQLQALAVDAEGRAQPPESLDALWFQCALTDEFFGPDETCEIDVPPCDSLEWTTDVGCELGRGGAFEFEFPALGPNGLAGRSMAVMGIIGREPGTDAEQCRRDILTSTSDSPPCTQVEAHVLIGPQWVLQFVAADAGFPADLPLEQIPALVLLQPANRAPAPNPPLWLDADTQMPLSGSPPRVRPSQRITAKGPQWRLQDRQIYATARGLVDTESFVFMGRQEQLGALYLASGPIRELNVDGSEIEILVDEVPTPAVIRVVMIVGDHRKDEDYGAVGMVVAELEVAR